MSDVESSAPAWDMHCGRRARDGELVDFGHPRYVQAHGHAVVIPVRLTETTDGPLWGFLRSGATEPCMIYEREGLFRMCFPYGADAEVEAGHGRVVRLRAEPLTTGVHPPVVGDADG